jgi:hypothetical protein
MGLLDDAIREHLELKRQHGGDPSEIERQEREALGARRSAAVEDEDAQAAPEGAPADIAEPDEPAAAREDAVFDAEQEDAAAPSLEVPEPDAEPGEAVDPPPEALREETAPGHDEDPWLVEETADPDPEQEDDVLEETPDFLQETPEHDRLWFEQKPPRDFDWDK